MSESSAPGALVLLAGASGTGKSRLCARLATHPPDGGVTVVRLDDFYLPGDADGLPTSADGNTDWDDARSWNAAAAAHTLRLLVHGRAAEVPQYDLATSSPRGRHRIEPRRLIVAEGLFADRLADELRDIGAVCVCVDRPAPVVALQRLARDVREHRKPLGVLVRRGWRLYRHHGDVVRRAAAVSATAPAGPARTEAYIRGLCAARAPTAG